MGDVVLFQTAGGNMASRGGCALGLLTELDQAEGTQKQSEGADSTALVELLVCEWSEEDGQRHLYQSERFLTLR